MKKLDRQIQQIEKSLLAWGFVEGVHDGRGFIDWTTRGIFRKTICKWAITVQSPRASTSWGTDHWYFRIRDLENPLPEDKYEFTLSGTVSTHKILSPLDSILEHLILRAAIRAREKTRRKFQVASDAFLAATKYL